MLADLQLPEEERVTGVRVGQFLITRVKQGGHTVIFETGPRTVVRIKKLEEASG